MARQRGDTPAISISKRSRLGSLGRRIEMGVARKFRLHWGVSRRAAMKSLLLTAAVLVIPTTALAEHGGKAADEALVAAHHKMMGGMEHLKPTGNPDKDFVMMMIPHHQGAIEMAKVEVQYGRDEKICTLAEAIIAAQEKEIGEMNDWLMANP